MKQDMQQRLTMLAAQSLLGGALALAASSSAEAKTFANISVSAGGRIASNPFLETAGAPSGQAVSLEIAPFVRFEGATSSLTVNGSARVDQYIKDYGTDVAGDVGANFVKRLNSSTSVRAGGSFRSSRTTLRDILTAGSDPAFNSGISPGVLADPTLIGRNRRNNIWSATVGLTSQISRNDILSIDGSINELRSPGQSLLDYRYASVQTSLSHRLSSRTSLQFTFTAGDSKYLNQRAGSGYTLTPMAGITTRLNSSFTLTALAGTTFSRIDRGDGTKVSNTTWAAQLSLCKRSERDTLCLSGARNTQPTAIGGVRSITSANLDFSKQLDQKNTIGAGLSFSQGSAGIGTAPGTINPLAESTRYIRASTTLSHRFNQRFVGYITPSVEHVRSNALSKTTGYQVNFGVRYILGDLR